MCTYTHIYIYIYAYIYIYIYITLGNRQAVPQSGPPRGKLWPKMWRETQHEVLRATCLFLAFGALGDPYFRSADPSESIDFGTLFSACFGDDFDAILAFHFG